MAEALADELDTDEFGAKFTARQLEPRMRDAFLDAADRMRESMGFRSRVESALISL